MWITQSQNQIYIGLYVCTCIQEQSIMGVNSAMLICQVICENLNDKKKALVVLCTCIIIEDSTTYFLFFGNLQEDI